MNQNLNYGNITEAVPALTRGNNVWSLFYDRPMLAKERLEVMGVPCINCEATAGMEMPWKNIALKVLTERTLNALTGNAMHLSAIASIIIYTLACTEF